MTFNTGIYPCSTTQHDSFQKNNRPLHLRNLNCKAGGSSISRGTVIQNRDHTVIGDAMSPSNLT